TIGLYKSKAKNIYNLIRKLVDDFKGEVPDTMEELLTLPGVGRKTASVVLANAFNIPAFAVDTHVFRVANRLGIVNEKDAEKTEAALLKAIDKNLWIPMHHLLIFHGRRTCIARKPKCEECTLTHLCKYYKDMTKLNSKKTTESKTKISRKATVTEKEQ
ncbi:MAG: endonuclease III, partial [Clostridiaceae bacterium]